MPFEHLGELLSGAGAGAVVGGPPGAIIGAGASLLGNIFGDISQGSMNKKQRQFALDMYQRQRSDALADWQMQNQYNSPQEQMARLKAAGLNPNLVYGNGAVANSTSQPRASSPQSWNPHVPEWSNIGNSMSQYFDTSIKEQQINNLKTQNDLMRTSMLLRAAQTGKNIASTAKDNWSVEQGKQLLAPTIDVLKSRVQQMAADIIKTQADTQFTLDANQRAQLMTSVNFSQGVERIALMKADEARTNADRERIYQAIDNMKKSGALLQWQVELSKRGITPNDPFYARAAEALLNQFASPQANQQKSVGGWNDFNDWLNKTTGGALDFR